MNDDGADVIPIRPGAQGTDEDRPVASDTFVPGTWCAHHRTRLDNTAHRVYCRDCGREMDPFAVLQHIAGDIEHWITYRKAAERRARTAQANLDELLRLERNAKSRARRRGT